MKKWEKPKLIVLVRGRAEETILNGCKTTRVAPPYVYGALWAYTDCSSVEDCPGCDLYVTS